MTLFQSISWVNSQSTHIRAQTATDLKVNSQFTHNNEMIFFICPAESGLSASLTIETGYQNMWKGGAVILKLENKDGLKGWRCWVCRGGESLKMVSLKLEGVNNSMVFQTADLNVDETIYWCTDKGRTHRSNQVILTTSGKHIFHYVFSFIEMKLMGVQRGDS